MRFHRCKGFSLQRKSQILPSQTKTTFRIIGQNRLPYKLARAAQNQTFATYHMAQTRKQPWNPSSRLGRDTLAIFLLEFCRTNYIIGQFRHRLRELNPAARGSQKEGFTQPLTKNRHFIVVHISTYSISLSLRTLCFNLLSIR